MSVFSNASIVTVILIRRSNFMCVARPSRAFHRCNQIGPDYSYINTFKNIFKNYDGILKRVKDAANKHSSIIEFLITQQFNFHAAHRMRRLVQGWTAYTKLYKDLNVKNIVKKIKNGFIGSNKSFKLLLGAAVFNWESNKITDFDLQSVFFLGSTNFSEKINCVIKNVCNSIFHFYFRCINDFDHIDRLNDHSSCNSSDLPSGETNNDSSNGSPNDEVTDNDSCWEKLLDKDHLKIWRKPLPGSNLYEYKVYGSFYDVPPHAFFSIQVDLEYRKKWDKHIFKLDVIDSDPESGCEVVHWIAHFPYPMYNREYVYIRKARIDHGNKVMVMSSKAIDHPKCTKNAKSVSVEKYKSQLVIRPHKSFNDVGFDYVLTYFDDPQAVFPSIAYNWIASSGVPEFVETLHNAAKTLYKERSNSKNLYFTPATSDKTSCPAQIHSFA
ncbi:StAR-related lipid transfer protein 7, mitochondrial [Nymphon striatum]|nr:StAR-related lipid transfer protein 7, mitochondrial [Nymphon striatum]